MKYGILLLSFIAISSSLIAIIMESSQKPKSIASPKAPLRFIVSEVELEHLDGWEIRDTKSGRAYLAVRRGSGAVAVIEIMP